MQPPLWWSSLRREPCEALFLRADGHPCFSRRSPLVFLDQDLYEKYSFVFSFLSLHPEWSEPRPSPSEKSLRPAWREPQPQHRPASVCGLQGSEALPWAEQRVDQRVFLWDRKDPAPLNSQPPSLERKHIQKDGQERRSSPQGKALARALKSQDFFWKLSARAKTRWKDQSGLYELAFMASSPPPGLIFLICKTVLVHKYWMSTWAQGNEIGPRYLAWNLRQGLGERGPKSRCETDIL